jgi:hypothetical protein
LSSTRKDGNEKLTIGPEVQNESEDEGQETKALPNPPDPGRQQGGSAPGNKSSNTNPNTRIVETDK